MKEQELYQLELEQIIKFFHGKRVLTKTDVMNYTGRGKKWLAGHFPKRHEWTATDLAYDLSKKIH